jgi:DNA-binding CsgD family transcriptional regulator
LPRATIGRTGEITQIGAFLDGVESAPRALFLEGTAGIGKTRLWTDAVGRARARGYRVLTTRPAQTEAELGFAALGDLFRDLSTEVLGQLPLPQARALRIALLLEEAPGASADPQAVALATLGALRVLARESPLVVAVDDAQWLDPASDRVLAFALRRVQGERVGLLTTLRLAAGEGSAVDLSTVFPPDSTHRLHLGPLTVAAVYELVRTRLGLSLTRPLLVRLHETSAGNPFYALEIARALAEAGVDPAPHEPLPVPGDLRTLIRQRLATLSPATQEALLAAAALARPSISLLERAVPGSTDALEEAARAGIVEVEADRVRFDHPLLASVHYATARVSTRRQMHSRLAAAIDDPEERAWHLALAAGGPDEEAAQALDHAAAAAQRRGAVVAAASLAEEALRLTPTEEEGTSHRRRIFAAELLFVAGDPQRAQALLGEEVEHASGVRRAELIWHLGRIRAAAENTEAGLKLYHTALGAADSDPRLQASILVDLANVAGIWEGYESALEYARRGVDLAERGGDDAQLAVALATFGDRSYMRGEPIPDDVMRRAIELEASSGMPMRVDDGPTALYAQMLADAGCLDEAQTLLVRLIRHARASGDAALTSPLGVLAALEYNMGHWEAAAEHAGEARTLAVQTGRHLDEAYALLYLAYLDTGLGDATAARARCAQLEELSRKAGAPLRLPRVVRGLLELSLGNYGAAWEALDPEQELNATEGMGRPRAQIPLVLEALAGMGRLDEARALLAPFKERAHATDRAWAIAAAARSLGLIAEAAGELEQAERALSEAATEGVRARYPLELGRTLLSLGRVQRRLRRKQAARATLGRAIEIFEGLPAVLWMERALEELRRIGGRAVPAGAGLSATEAKIADLVAAGHTNREVARLLHLSAKTVEWNLSKIYRKLGVRSRSELAAAAARSSMSSG